MRASDGNTVFNVDLGSYAITVANEIQGGASSIAGDGGLAFDGRNIWVGIGVNDNPSNINLLFQVRPSDGAILNSVNLGTSSSFSTVSGVAFDGANIWAARTDGFAVKVRVSDLTVQGTVPVDGSAFGIAFGGGNIWVACNSSGLVTRFAAGPGLNSPTSFSVHSTNESAPVGIAFDGVNMWITAMADNVVVKMGPDGSVLGTYNVGSAPSGVVFDGANIWVANSRSNTVTKLRASDGSIIGTFSVTASPMSLIFDGANIWVASTNNTLTKL
jgi:hypothetical protein